jgi:tocopherol O-methyltransferase
VLAIESTEHMADIGRALDEMERVLRPGGRLVVCAWLARENASSREVRHLLRPICAEGRLARLLTAAELEGLLADRGLIPEGVRDYSREVSRTWTICMRRAFRRLMTDARARRFLLDPSQSERIFARTLVRIRAAFALGSLRYGIVAAVRRGRA